MNLLKRLGTARAAAAMGVEGVSVAELQGMSSRQASRLIGRLVGGGRKGGGGGGPRRR